MSKIRATKNRLNLQFWSCAPTTLTDVVYTLTVCVSSPFLLWFCFVLTERQSYTLHPHKKYGAHFVPQTDARATIWEQLYADAEMSRHILCVRTQTFYISFDFGVTRVWNRNNNNRSATENILEIRRPLLRNTCPRNECSENARPSAAIVKYILVECYAISCCRIQVEKMLFDDTIFCLLCAVDREFSWLWGKERSPLFLAFSKGTGNVNLQFLWWY